ncbi:MAG: shikimate dehydrogenase [Nitriliruptoraceae bacterium]
MSAAQTSPWPSDGQPWPTAATRPVVLLGWPVRHSRSPELHNAAFAAEGLDLIYLALPVPPEAVSPVLTALGAVGAVGANVTVPHKRAALAACDTLSTEARLIGAVNTLVWTADGLEGDNTDATGLHHALLADVLPVPGQRFLVLGTGGAARAAAVAIARLGGQLTVVGRHREAAAELASIAADAGASDPKVLHLGDTDAVTRARREARVVINATPLGMHGERLPDEVASVGEEQIAYDLVYDPPVTPFLAEAAQVGARTVNGASMLLHQAAASFTRWTGRAAPLAVMAAAIGLEPPPDASHG